MIKVNVVKGTFTEEEKSGLIRELTDSVARIKGEDFRPLVWVLIEDVSGEAWGVGGNAVGGAAPAADAS